MALLPTLLTHTLHASHSVRPPTDPRKELRIDGLKTKSFKNFIVLTCSTTCPPQPEPTPIDVRFNRPTTEFGVMFKTSNVGVTLFTQLQVTANGEDLGTLTLDPDAVQYLGVSAPEGLTSLRLVPMNPGNPMIGAFIGYRLYYK